MTESNVKAGIFWADVKTYFIAVCECIVRDLICEICIRAESYNATGNHRPISVGQRTHADGMRASVDESDLTGFAKRQYSQEANNGGLHF